MAEKDVNYVKVFHEDYSFIFAKQPRYKWVKHTVSESVYFIYITRIQKDFVDKKTANVVNNNYLCYSQMFFNYHDMMLRIEPILSEYILDSHTIFDIAINVQKLEYDEEDYVEQQG